MEEIEYNDFYNEQARVEWNREEVAREERRDEWCD